MILIFKMVIVPVRKLIRWITLGLLAVVVRALVTERSGEKWFNGVVVTPQEHSILYIHTHMYTYIMFICLSSISVRKITSHQNYNLGTPTNQRRTGTQP